MSFKIVSTIEKRGVYFMVVPHQWEKNKILFWPEHLIHSEREKLRADATCVPAEEWVQYPCSVKCSSITNFQDALRLEKQIAECTDTEAEERLFISRENEEIEDRNAMFDEALPTSNANCIVGDGDIPNTEFSFINLTEGTDFKTVETALKKMETEVTALRNEIKAQYIKINLNLDKIYQILNKQDSHQQLQTKTTAADLLGKFKFPLSTSEDISLLEEEIRSKSDFKSQLITFLSRIGGTSGEEDGTKTAYKIVDALFKADLLTQYSWTGVSRGKAHQEKKPFQILEGIIGVFYETLLLADSRHTKTKNSNIFKECILKHARKRSQRKRVTATEREAQPVLEQTQPEVEEEIPNVDEAI